MQSSKESEIDSSDSDVDNFQSDKVIVRAESCTANDSTQPALTKHTSTTQYRLCGDNVDKTVRQRYLRSDSYQTKSVHYFHSYAVADCMDFSNLSEESPFPKPIDANDLASMLLPTIEDDRALRQNFKTLISRIENIEYFKNTFDGVIEWHIKHCYYDEMSMW